VAQQAYRSGDALAKVSVTDADRIAAVVQFDFVVETMLRGVLFEAKHAQARTERFRDLLKLVGEVLSPGYPQAIPLGQGGLEQVRSIRNAAQHEARSPTQVEVTECAIHTRGFVVEAARVAWDLDFFAADIAAVRSERVRNYLERAGAAHQALDVRAAMGWVRAAFEYAFKHGGENVVGPSVDVRELLVVDRAGRTDGRHSRDGAEAAIALTRLQVLGRLTAFGMNLREYIYWRNTFLSAPALNINDELAPPHDREPDWTSEDYDRAFAYVTDSVLRMEQIVEDVDPGGFTRGGFDKL
jgi:hypothetical protein